MVPLAGKPKLARRARGAQPLALALKQHGQFADNLIVGRHGQRSFGSLKDRVSVIESQHDSNLQRRQRIVNHGRERRRTDSPCQIKYGTLVLRRLS